MSEYQPKYPAGTRVRFRAVQGTTMVPTERGGVVTAAWLQPGDNRTPVKFEGSKVVKLARPEEIVEDAQHELTIAVTVAGSVAEIDDNAALDAACGALQDGGDVSIIAAASHIESSPA